MHLNIKNDPFLKIFHPNLTPIYEKYLNGLYLPPLKVIYCEGSGYEVIASHDIEKNVFICEYSGDIVPHCIGVK